MILNELRNSLLNVLDVYIWGRDYFLYRQYGQGDIEEFSRRLWFHYFKKPMDSRADRPHKVLAAIRDYYFGCSWYEVYVFVEYALLAERNSRLIGAINNILERELSGYRFIESAFVPVTDEVEVEAIEKALTEGPFKGVHAHLKKAMEHLS